MVMKIYDRLLLMLVHPSVVPRRVLVEFIEFIYLFSLLIPLLNHQCGAQTSLTVGGRLQNLYGNSQLFTLLLFNIIFISGH